ncbi:MAG: RNA-binding cell elongation regulator Jag/EloR [Inconstantimicrobium porci]|uniref:RNA-binding cell elongation regulator Jag/EloR n=1 Tax=Inconstantimicrobium porci TaxID=2652291 RepID=UPI002A911CB6|nr:RNA-binding cell elongation regulator Jag/EloR [Inconstantimicrobium porci]MDY5911394.1 RNA-binding cell elongation regulator Jag/EloR [Inconstantimicrobium porci]
MESREFQGRTVDEALESAALKLSLAKDSIDYTVIDEGSRGFLNIIGSKPAKIMVKLKRDSIKEAKRFLYDIFENMGISATIETEETDDAVRMNIYGDNMGVIIGYRGETLDSLQYLTSLVLNKDHNEPYRKIILDAENYRLKREQTLRNLAEKTAARVIKSGRAFKLEPMNPYERRIIHSELQGNSEIVTFSEGEEPYRRVVVNLKNT